MEFVLHPQNAYDCLTSMDQSNPTKRSNTRGNGHIAIFTSDELTAFDSYSSRFKIDVKTVNIDQTTKPSHRRPEAVFVGRSQRMSDGREISNDSDCKDYRLTLVDPHSKTEGSVKRTSNNNREARKATTESINNMSMSSKLLLLIEAAASVGSEGKNEDIGALIYSESQLRKNEAANVSAADKRNSSHQANTEYCNANSHTTVDA
eukprot:scaffold36603_cov183-Skeletonema_dohrnii-CCMP3373.AAC.1